VSGPLGPSVARVVASGVSVGDLLANPIFIGMVSKVFRFARMLDFKASVAAMSLEDINDVLTNAN